MFVCRLMCLTKNRLGFRLDKRGIQRLASYSTVISQSNVQHQNQSQRSNVTFGQPTNLTHPHIVKPGELLPGIKLGEFRERRTKLMERILSDEYVAKNPGNSHIVVIPSSSKVYMSDKIPYVFRQNTDFLYFTGCQEPDSLLVITAKGENFVSTLFVRKKDQHSELWDGPRTGVEASIGMFDVDLALPISDFEHFFVSHMNENNKSHVWYENTEPVQPEIHKKLAILMKIVNNQTFLSPTRIFHEIRLIKSPAEIKLMQKSCEIASAAIAKSIEISNPNITEHQLFATVDYECRMKGAEFLAYPPVVAGGRNANVIHYIANNQVVQGGEMVLMDADENKFLKKIRNMDRNVMNDYKFRILIKKRKGRKKPQHRGIKFTTNDHSITDNKLLQKYQAKQSLGFSEFSGCEYHGYSSDITRTWPIDGTFTSQQRILYEIVLDVQKNLTNRLKELPTLDQVFHDMCLLLGQRLQEVGLIPTNLSGDKLLAAAYTYCPHHVSHYLGMDVHDAGKISRSVKTIPGMIVTMEPGIYVNPRNQMAPADFHGIGIRIEDDVLIRENGPLVLTASCPKEITDIEALAKKNQSC